MEVCPPPTPRPKAPAREVTWADCPFWGRGKVREASALFPSRQSLGRGLQRTDQGPGGGWRGSVGTGGDGPIGGAAVFC